MAKKLRNSTPEIDEWDEIEFFDLDNFGDLAEDTKDKSGLRYVKNVFKSVKNLSVKLGEALLPQTSGLAGELKNAGSEFRDQFTDFKDKAIDQISKLRSKANSGKTISKESIGQEATALFQDMKKDISERFKTGKFVKGPEDEVFDMDFGFGDDDDSAPSSSSENQAIVKQEKDPNAPIRARITQAKNRNKKLQFELENERFQSLKEATLGASEASVAASIDMFQKAQMLEEARHHVTTQYLKNMAVNIYKLTSIQGQALAADIEYGKKSLALSGDLTRFIKEMHQMQSESYRENEKFKQNRRKSGSKIEDVFGYSFSGSEWAKNVVGNMKDMVMMSPIGMMMGMLPMIDMMNMGGGKGVGGTAKNLIKSMNPFNILLNLTMSSKMKYGRERIEKMFGAIPQLINQRLVSMQDEGGWKGLLGSILGIRDEQGVVKTDKYANMNLDAPSQLDVRTKRTINEVIPLQLSQLIAATTGREETRYDFRTGKFRTVSSIERQRKAVMETAMKSDWDFNRAATTIETGAMKSDGTTDKKLLDGIKAINMHLVNSQKGFDWDRLVDPKTRQLKDDQDARYYKKQLLQKVKGTDEEKEQVFQAFVRGYNALINDKSNPGGTQYFKAGMAITKANLNRGLQNFADEIATNYSGGMNVLSTGQHDKLIKNIDIQIEMWKKRESDNTPGFSKQLVKERIASLQMQKAQLMGESGGGFVNKSTVDIADQGAYQMEQKFMSVPNMLKNLTEILLNGIVVYPMTKMPNEAKKFLQGQKDYLSAQAFQAAKEVQDQLDTEQKARDEVNKTNLERMQMQRDFVYGRETGLAATGFGRAINKGIGTLYNFFNQAFLSPVAGFDGSVDFTDDYDSLKSSSDALTNKTGVVRDFAEKAAEKGGIIGAFGKFLKSVTVNIEKTVNISENQNSEENDFATKLKKEVDGLKGKLKETIAKHPWVAKQLDFVSNRMISHPDEAVELSNIINEAAAEGKPIETAISEFADSKSEKSFYDNLESMSNISGGKSKNINKSKVKNISNSYNKTYNKVEFNTQPLETRLDRIIEILESRGNSEDGYKVSGMDEVISLLVSMNANLINPQQMNQIAGEIQKTSQGKKPLWKKILGFPKFAAGKLKDAAMWGVKQGGSIFGNLGTAIGNALPGVSNFLGGAVQGIGNFLGNAGKSVFGGLFGLGKKGVNKASELLNQAKTRVRRELDELAENGGLNIDTILARFSKEELIQKVASITGKSEEELMNLSPEQLAQELLKFWKSKSGSGFGGVLEGLGNAAKGAFGFGKEALKQGGDVAKSIGKAGWDTTKSLGSNLAKVIFGNGEGTGSGGLLNLSVGGGTKNVAILKGILANTIAIRGLLEAKFEIPADMSAANAQAEQVARSGKGVLGRAVSLIGKGFGKLGNFLKSIPGRLKGLYTGIKGKVAGFRDRGDGSGIAEGSYADYKKDAEEAKIEQREENKEQYLETIAENTSFLVSESYKNKFKKDDSNNKQGLKIGAVGKGLLAGGALVAGGAALFAGNFMANKKKKEQYQAEVENGSMTQEEADREGKFDNVEKGNMMARSVVMAIKGIDKILNVLFKMKPLNKFITGPTKNVIQKAIINALTKFAPKLGGRLAAFIGIGAGSAGISTALQAAAGFVWGMARASNYFRDILGPGQKITLAMRVTAGLVKALDFALMGIPDIICTFMGTNPVMWIYNMIKDIIGGPASDNGKWEKQRADIYGLKSNADVNYVISNKNNSSWKKLGFKSKKIFDEWYSRRFEPIYQLEEQLSNGNEEIVDGSYKDQTAVENFRKAFISKARQLIQSQNLGKLTYAAGEADVQTAGGEAALVGGAAAVAGTAAGFSAANPNNPQGSAHPEKLAEMKPQEMSDPNLGPEIAVASGAAIATVSAINQSSKSAGQEALEKANVNYFYANVGILANLISIRKLMEIQSGISSTIDKDQIEAEKVASTGAKMTSTDSGSLIRNIEGTARKAGVFSGVKDAAKRLGGWISGWFTKGGEAIQQKGEELQEYANNSNNPIVRHGGAAVGKGMQKIGEAVANIPQTAKEIAEKIKNFVTGADISGLRPIAKQRLAGLAEDYYNKYGKKLKINSGSRTIQKQEELYKKSQANAVARSKGLKIPYPGIGKAAKPSPLSPHIAGIAIDVDSSEVMKMKQDGLLDKWGWYQAALRPDLPISDPSSEFWHLEIRDSRNPSSTSKTGWSPVSEANLKYIDMLGTQLIEGGDSQLKNIGNGGKEDLSSGKSEVNNPGSVEDLLNIPTNTSSSFNKSNYQTANTIANVANKAMTREIDISNSQSSSDSSYSTSSSVSSNIGINDANQQMGEVSGLVKIMEQIEVNTKRSADILAEHLPQLGNIFQILGAILQATVNNASGISSGSSEADMAAAIIAKANY